MYFDLGKLIVAKGFKNLPKVQEIAQSGHTAPNVKEQQHFGGFGLVIWILLLLCLPHEIGPFYA